MVENGVYSPEYGDTGYMEQEEEWEREGLLDPAWEKQQKKVSTFLLPLKNFFNFQPIQIGLHKNVVINQTQ